MENVLFNKEAREAKKEARKEARKKVNGESSANPSINKTIGLGMAMSNLISKNEIKDELIKEGNATVTETVNSLNQSPTIAGTELVKTVADGDGDFNALQSATKDAEVANREEVKQKQIVAEEIDKANQDLNNAVIEQEKEEVLPGSGIALANKMTEKDAIAFDEGATVRSIQDRMAELASNAGDDASTMALEGLNIQDYYPNINKDIAVGTHTGRYSGTSTIFTAPGALIPLGLYNARKKALADAAKAKAALIDKIMTVPETSAQYQMQFNEAFFNGLNPFIKETDDINSLPSNISFRKYMANMEAKAKEISKSEAFAKAILEDAKGDSVYVPESMVKTAMDVMNNQIDNLDAVLAGDANAVAPFKDATAYVNLRPKVDTLAKDLLDPARMAQQPLSFKTGGKYDTEEWVSNRNQFIAQVNAGGIGAKEYVTGIRKFYSGEFEGMIDALVESEGGSKEQGEALKDYFRAQIQEQVVLDYKTIKTDDVAMANLNFQKSKWQAEQANFWGNINNFSTTEVNPKTGKSFNDEVSALSNSNLTTEQKKARIKDLSVIYGVGEVKYDPINKTWTNYVKPTPAQVSKNATPGDPNGLVYTVTIETIKNGKKTYATTNVPFTKLNTVVGDKKFSINGKWYNPKTKNGEGQIFLDNVNNAKQRGVYLKDAGTEIKKGFIKNGTFHYLNEDNIDEYNNSQSKTVLAVPIYQTYTRTSSAVAGAKGDDYEAVEMDVPIGGTVYGMAENITNVQGQETMNGATGYTTKAAAESVGDGSSASGSSYSW